MNTRLQQYLIVAAVMLVAIIEVLDITIVNVSLPAMQGSLGANTEQITWVLTSYSVSAAIFMPLTGLLVKRFGRKQLLLMNIVGFMLASALCGMATSLSQIVLFRTLQGIFGASLVPLSQYILRDSFDEKELGKAMAIWGVGIMTGPIVGPTLGGYISEALNWRWIFYINIPVCVVAFLLASRVISETAKEKVPIDWLGFALLVFAVGGLQIVLDQGSTKDWFNSAFIVTLSTFTILAWAVFIRRGLKIKNNIVNFRLFADKTFTTSTIVLTLFVASLFSGIVLLPIMMEQVMGYPTLLTGLMMAPRGIASAFTMFAAGSLMKRYSVRSIATVGIVIAAIGTYMLTQLSINTSTDFFVYSAVLQGLGMGLFFVPLSAVAFKNLTSTNHAEAAGLFSFGRTMGGAIGISIFSTVLTRQTQISWHQLAAKLNPFNPHMQQWLAAQIPHLSQPQAYGKLASMLSKQALMIAFIDCFVLTFVCLLVILPLLWFLPGKDKHIVS